MKTAVAALVLGTMLLMTYDPRTGITSYADPAATADEADVAAPSTATSFSAPTGPGLFSPPMQDAFARTGSPNPLEQRVDFSNPLAYSSHWEAPTTAAWKEAMRTGVDPLWKEIPYVDPRPVGFTGRQAKGPKSQFANNQKYGLNPATGQWEPLFKVSDWNNLEDPHRYFLASDPNRPAEATPFEYSLDGGTLFDQVMPLVTAGIMAYATGGAAGAAFGTGAAASGAIGSGLTGYAMSDGDWRAAAAAAAAGGAGGALGGAGGDGAIGAEGAAGSELGGLSDAELADILAGGSGDTATLTGGGMLTSTQAALRELSAKTGIPVSVLQRAAQFGTGYAQSGDARAAALGTGLTAGANAAAPYVNSAVDYLFPGDVPATPSTATSFADAGFDPKRQGMLLAQADTGTMSDMPFTLSEEGAANLTGMRMLSNPEGAPLQFQAGALPADPVFSEEGMMNLGGMQSISNPGGTPFQFQEVAPGQFSVLREPTTPPDFLNGPGPSETKPPSDQEKRDADTAKNIERVAKIGRAMAQLHEGRGEPQDAPRRQDGQSEGDYAQSLVQYANLDAQAMADQGLVPGTQPYYDFIMAQMDSIISQVTGGLDENGNDLASQLRAKSREELDALERALYVRGQIGQLMGSGKYTDPFSGNSEDVVAPDGAQVNPGLAAYQRGLARRAVDFAGMLPSEARASARQWFGSDPDLFGMGARADERSLAEALASQNMSYDDWKRRHGMFSPPPQNDFSWMS